jgi:hypothetical protein
MLCNEENYLLGYNTVLSGLHGVISLKILALFITTVLRTSNLIYVMKYLVAKSMGGGI